MISLSRIWAFVQNNVVLTALILSAMFGSGYYGYNWYVEYARPDSIPPVIKASQDKYEVGDTVILKIDHSNKNIKHVEVIWRVFDNYVEKIDFTQLNDSCILFGTGKTEKTFFVVASVSYTGKNYHKDYICTVLVKIGAGPIPPPNPPSPPIPPSPPNPPIPPSPPSFPNEKFGLSTVVYNEYNKINHVTKTKMATEFASHFNIAIDLINNGSAKNSEELLKNININNNSVLSKYGVERGIVAPFFEALRIKLVAIDNANGLENLANLKQCFIEVRDGLQAIK